MVPGHNLLAFGLVAFLLIVAPGPSVLFIVSRALSLGRRTAFATVAGNELGEAAQVVVVAFGLGAIVERSIVVFTVLKLVGAAYLIYLGVRTFRRRHSLSEAMGEVAVSRGTGRSVLDAFVVGVSNPKTVVFLAAILPQFVDPTVGHVSAQLVELGLLFVLIAAVSDTAWALVAGTARAWFERSPRRLRAVGGAGGLTMIGLGLGLAFTGRKS